jgi:outer membrane protein insertion porin family
MVNGAFINIMILAFMVLMPSLAFPDENESRLIESIEVRGLMTIEEDELLYLMGLRQGGQYTDETVTEGIKRAFMKDIFIGMEVDAENGRIIVTVSEKDIIERINIQSARLRQRDLQNVLGLKRGDYVTDDFLADRIDVLEEFIRKKGYPDCQVHHFIRRLTPDNLIELNLDIDEGSPRIIDEIVVYGRPSQEVTKRLHFKSGDRFDSIVLEQDIEALMDYYVRRGFLAPEIGPVEFVEGKLVLRVKAGRRLKYTINTIKRGLFFPELTDQEVIEMMPFLNEGEINDDLLAEGVERVIEEYRSRGYSDVQVAPVVKTDNGDIEVRLYISEGTIKNVRSFNVIRDGVAVTEGVNNVVNNRRGRDYQPFRLDDDAELIREFYAAIGYRDASVSEPRASIDGDFVDIYVDVRAGNRYFIKGVQVSGNESIPDDVIENQIKLESGDPFNEVDVLSSRREAQSICRSRGFYYCTVQVAREFAQDGVHLDFELNEGDRFYFGKTVISGNRLIHTDTVRRHLKYREGDPLNQEKLILTRQRLLGLGVFSSVETEIVFAEDHIPDVHIRVSESSPGKVDFGIGYGEYEGPRTFIEIGYRNLFGDADLGSLRLEASTLWRRYILNYTEPYLFGTDFRSRTFLLREEREQKNSDTDEISYRVIKNTASTGLERNISKHVSASLYYEYSIVDTYDVKPGIVLSKEDEGTVAISSLIPGIYYSSLDDPFDPSRGLLVGLTLKDAADYLLSEAEYSKVTLKASSYIRLGGRVVGAISLGGGTAEIRGDTESIPLVERFYLGGRNSVRGFEQDSIGPVDSNGDPIGGRYFLLGNLEFRVRLLNSWRTVLFADCGNVWLDRNDASTSDMRCSVGTGIRYRTPVGPLRLDYGWKIDRLEGEDPGELHFSIGHVF